MCGATIAKRASVERAFTKLASTQKTNVAGDSFQMIRIKTTYDSLRRQIVV